jgi:DNA-binding transcriptional regulator YhcF (GntR family)
MASVKILRRKKVKKMENELNRVIGRLICAGYSKRTILRMVKDAVREMKWRLSADCEM